MDTQAVKYARNVWNYDEALGWLGGIYSIIFAIVEYLLTPFTKDELVFRIVQITNKGKLAKLDSLKFKAMKSISNIFCNCQRFAYKEYAD